VLSTQYRWARRLLTMLRYRSRRLTQRIRGRGDAAPHRSG